LPGPTSSIYSNTKFYNSFNFIFTIHLVKKIRGQILAFYGGHCVLGVKINPPQANLLSSGPKKTNKNEKQHCKLLLKIAKVLKNVQQWCIFYNLFCTA
jgi:hypothetical protein